MKYIWIAFFYLTSSIPLFAVDTFVYTGEKTQINNISLLLSGENLCIYQNGSYSANFLAKDLGPLNNKLMLLSLKDEAKEKGMQAVSAGVVWTAGTYGFNWWREGRKKVIPRDMPLKDQKQLKTWLVKLPDIDYLGYKDNSDILSGQIKISNDIAEGLAREIKKQVGFDPSLVKDLKEFKEYLENLRELRLSHEKTFKKLGIKAGEIDAGIKIADVNLRKAQDAVDEAVRIYKKKNAWWKRNPLSKFIEDLTAPTTISKKSILFEDDFGELIELKHRFVKKGSNIIFSTEADKIENINFKKLISATSKYVGTGMTIAGLTFGALMSYYIYKEFSKIFNNTQKYKLLANHLNEAEPESLAMTINKYRNTVPAKCPTTIANGKINIQQDISGKKELIRQLFENQ